MELVLRKPFLPGETDVDQLKRIIAVLGTPTDEDWPVSRSKARAYMGQLTDIDRLLLGSSISSGLLSSTRIRRTALDTLGSLGRQVWDRFDTQDATIRSYQAHHSQRSESASQRLSRGTIAAAVRQRRGIP